MQTFLGKTAAHIWAQHPVEDLKDVAVVMPSQRSVLYLKKELALQSDHPFLSPSFFTIEEFAIQMTQSKLIDPISLLFEAYSCFKEVDPKVDFDRFVSWGQMMLKDFDTLDMYLVDPFQLFSFLSEAKSIERWGEEYGEPHPEKFITPHTESYFKLYDHLLEVYGRLRSRLEDQGLVYRGLAYRHLHDQLDQDKALAKNFKKIYFVGFNALSKGEESIIRLLVKQGIAQTLWDADSYYVKNPFHRAGNWLRNYADPGSTEYLSNGPFQWMGQDLLTNAKTVKVLGMANPSAQVFVALDIIRTWQQAYGPGEQVALVLGDEALLDQVLLYIGEFKDRLNITMGYSIKKSWAFSLIQLWWELGKQEPQGRYSASLFQQVISHPWIQGYLSKKNYEVGHLVQSNDLYVPSVRLDTAKSHVPLLNHLFCQHTASLAVVLGNLASLVEALLKSVADKEWDEEAQAMSQAISVVRTLIKTLEGRDELSWKSGKMVLTQLLQQQKLTFEGNEIRTLHVMGLLETRTLDFDRVIVLSMNEGSLPGTRKRESLIPVDIANMNAFALPTFTQADAVASYHIHRLFQRPREIVMCYVQPSEKSSIKEMSRFIRQLKYDWTKKNPLIDWQEPEIKFVHPEALARMDYSIIPKTPEMLDEIKASLAKYGLSASGIAMFASCSLQYYYNQIKRLRKEKDQEEEMGADVFGTWVHKVLELVDKEVLADYAGDYDEAGLQERMSGSLDYFLEKAMSDIQKSEGNFEIEKGFNYVLKEVAKTLLESYYQQDAWSKHARLLEVEISLPTEIQVTVGDENLQVRVNGRIDRLDYVGSTLRILDYKTGKVEAKDVVPSELGLRNDVLEGDLKTKLMQLWLYKYLLAKELQKPIGFRNEKIPNFLLSDVSIEPGIISFRNLNAGILSDEATGLWFSEGEGWDRFIAESEAILGEWVRKILDPETVFEKTKDVKACSFCDFKRICQREI